MMPSSSIGLRTACLAVSLLTLAPMRSHAADGAPPADVACRRSGDVSVVSRPRAEDPGEDIYVRSAPASSSGQDCTYAPQAGDWVVGKGEPDYVLAVQGHVLALDSGTAEARRLLIFETGSRKKLIDIGYDDAKGRFAAGPDAITYWRIGSKPVKPAACPAAWRKDKDHRTAKQAHRIYEVRFGLSDEAARDTGKTDCRLTEDDIQ